MKGKVTGLLSLAGFLYLLRNPGVHQALNDYVERAFRKAALFIRRGRAGESIHDRSVDVPSEEQTPPPGMEEKRARQKQRSSDSRGKRAKPKRTPARSD